MRIGTDASLSECYREGYLVMEFKKRELMPKGSFNKECYVRFIQHLPDYAGGKIGTRLLTDIRLCYNDVFEQYQRHKDDIDSFGDFKYSEPEYVDDFLNLADIVNSYCGLE